MKHSIMVGLPCYNEGENIEALVKAWQERVSFFQALDISLDIVLLDDKSTDDTKCLIERLAAGDAHITGLYHSVNQNLGGGLNTLIHYFLSHYHSGDYLVIMDADNTQDPKYILSMFVKCQEGADVVIASRYRKSARVLGLHPVRRLLSLGARFYYSLVLQVPGVRDYTCGYRLYTYDILAKVQDGAERPLIKSRSFACMMELLYKLHCAGAVFSEVPFVLRYDQKRGMSKMKIGKTVKDSVQTALQLRWGKG